jgi:hypothetical protein
LKVFFIIFCLVISFTIKAQYFEVPSSDKDPTKTFLIEALEAKATVIFFQGGDGVLNIKTDGSNNRIDTPMIRSATFWKNYNINYVMVDSPYDLGDYRRGNRRGSSDHLDRVVSVINFYKNRLNVPLWIYGHSMGTSTVIRVANRSGNSIGIAGIVIAGTLEGEVVSNEFNKPVLAIHHVKDSCRATPLSASEKIIRERNISTMSQLIQIDGGESIGDPCRGYAYHGFNKVEDKVVESAAKFILRN